ncbi:hypothetical protein RYX36_025154 [Vicia faba]
MLSFSSCSQQTRILPLHTENHNNDLSSSSELSSSTIQFPPSSIREATNRPQITTFIIQSATYILQPPYTSYLQTIPLYFRQFQFNRKYSLYEHILLRNQPHLTSLPSAATTVIKYLEKSEWFSQPNFTVTTIESQNSVSAGDALCVVYERNVIQGDLVLISGDTVSNMSLINI